MDSLGDDGSESLCWEDEPAMETSQICGLSPLSLNPPVSRPKMKKPPIKTETSKKTPCNTGNQPNPLRLNSLDRDPEYRE